MTTAELIEVLDNRYGNPLAKDCELIHQAIALLQLQAEEIVALHQQIQGK